MSLDLSGACLIRCILTLFAGESVTVDTDRGKTRPPFTALRHEELARTSEIRIWQG
jgi:hypothetical protein